MKIGLGGKIAIGACVLVGGGSAIIAAAVNGGGSSNTETVETIDTPHIAPQAGKINGKLVADMSSHQKELLEKRRQEYREKVAKERAKDNAPDGKSHPNFIPWECWTKYDDQDVFGYEDGELDEIFMYFDKCQGNKQQGR